MVTTRLGKVSLTPRGEFNIYDSYKALDVVCYRGSGYIVKRDCSGVYPYNGDYFMLISEKGENGSYKTATIPYNTHVIIPVNTECIISELEGSIEISLGEKTEDFSNEWVFIITQGQNTHDIVLPEISWVLGIAPTFSSNSITEVRLHYKGDILEGVWN